MRIPSTQYQSPDLYFFPDLSGKPLTLLVSEINRNRNRTRIFPSCICFKDKTWWILWGSSPGSDGCACFSAHGVQCMFSIFCNYLLPWISLYLLAARPWDVTGKIHHNTQVLGGNTCMYFTVIVLFLYSWITPNQLCVSGLLISYEIRII